MPRQQDKRLSNRPTVDTTGITQEHRVTASPVSQLVVTPRDRLGDVARALGGLSEGLADFGMVNAQEQALRKQMAAKDAKERAKEDRVKGEAHFVAHGSKVDPSLAYPDEATSEYQEGYLSMYGRDMGRSVGDEMRELYQQAKDQDGFNLEAFLSDYHTKQLAGFDQPAVLKEYLPALIKAKDDIRDEYHKEQLEQVREKARGFAAGEARHVVQTMQEDPAELHAEYLAGGKRAQAVGVDRKEWAEMFLSHALERLEQGPAPTLVEAMSLRDENGVSLMDLPGVADKVAEAQARADAKVKKELIEHSQVANAYTMASMMETLKKNPFAIPASEVLGNIGPGKLFATENEATSFWGKVMEARDKQGSELDLSKIAPGLETAYMGHPDYKKKVQEGYQGIVERWNSGALQTRDAIVQILGQYQRYGVAPESLKGYFGSAMLPTVKKEEEIPPAAERSLELYNQINSSTNPGLLDELMDSDTRARFALMSDEVANGKSFTQAYMNVQQMFTPEARARAEAALTPQARQEIRKLAGSKFEDDSYFLPLRRNASNVSDMQNKMLALTEHYIRKGVPMEKAPDQAIADLKARHVYALGQWVEVPRAGIDKLSFPDALERHMRVFAQTEEVKARAPDAKVEQYQIMYRRDGGYNVFAMGDYVGEFTAEAVINEHFKEEWAEKARQIEVDRSTPKIDPLSVDLSGSFNFSNPAPLNGEVDADDLPPPLGAPSAPPKATVQEVKGKLEGKVVPVPKGAVLLDAIKATLAPVKSKATADFVVPKAQANTAAVTGSPIQSSVSEDTVAEVQARIKAKDAEIALAQKDLEIFQAQRELEQLQASKGLPASDIDSRISAKDAEIAKAKRELEEFQAQKLSPAEVKQNWKSIEDLKHMRQITPDEYESLREMRKKHEGAQLETARQVVRAVADRLPKAPDLRNDPEPLAPPPVPKQVSKRDPGVKELVARLHKSNPDVALVARGEGFQGTIGKDSRGRIIGFGFNVDLNSTSKEASNKRALQLLKRSGVARPEDVMSGKASISVEQGVRLYALSREEYVKRAKAIIGHTAWDLAPEHVKAVLSDMAYVTYFHQANLGGEKKFKAVLRAAQRGDWKSVARNLESTARFPDGKGGYTMKKHARSDLWKVMLHGPEAFNQYVNGE